MKFFVRIQKYLSRKVKLKTLDYHEAIWIAWCTYNNQLRSYIVWEKLLVDLEFTRWATDDDERSKCGNVVFYPEMNGKWIPIFVIVSSILIAFIDFHRFLSQICCIIHLDEFGFFFDGSKNGKGGCPKQEIQLENLKQKAVAHTRALVSTSITSAQAWIHHMMCFVPSVGYPLPVCHLNDSQLHSLQSNYIMVLNNKLSFPQSYAHNVIFGPQSHGGIGSLDLQTEGGLGTLETIIRSLQTPGHAQSIIMIFLTQ